ncbi:MAG: coenzyme F420-0:L-glutamate ligase [Patescibacteria group bacterium]|nr:coenzyme F420-0:L-glutamate ligase [Patescibacteria group bacterium]
MKITPIKTRIINPPRDNIYKIIDQFCPKLVKGDVLVITSKIISIHQGRCLPVDSVKSKDKLIKRQADLFISRKKSPGQHVILTLKNNTLIPSAGIDQSNARGHYILWPEKPYQQAKKICQYLRKKFHTPKIAVIITDSHSTPLRYGVLGISIGFFGLYPLKDYRGEKDIFKKPLKSSQANIIDALAAAATLVIGESDQKTPMALIQGAKFLRFTNKTNKNDLLVPPKKDIFYPLLKTFFKKP